MGTTLRESDPKQDSQHGGDQTKMAQSNKQKTHRRQNQHNDGNPETPLHPTCKGNLGACTEEILQSTHRVDQRP